MSYLGRLNSLLTSTTSRYDSLRRNILSSSSEDDTNLTDPSTSHVSRVLRAYYTEKSLPFPTWLGPDPNTTTKAAQYAPQPYATSRPIGSLRSNASDASMVSQSGGRGGGLSDLWSDGPSAPAVMEERGSLRRTPVPGGRRPGMLSANTTAGGFGGSGDGAGGGGLNVRPLPSQRAGSYQTQGQMGNVYQSQGQAGRTSSPVPPGSSGGAAPGGGGAAERLKARLQRGGSGRSVSSFEGGGGQGGGYQGQGQGRDDGRGGAGGSGSGGSGGGQGSYATQGLSGWQGRR